MGIKGGSRLLLFVSISTALFAAKGRDTTPWFTGPLLTPTGYVVPLGSYDLEPYLFVTKNSGAFDSHWTAHSVSSSWRNNVQILSLIGLAKRLDLQLIPQGFYNYNHGAHTLCFGDLPLGFDFQIYYPKLETWYPSVKFTLLENLPLGKYQKLNPHKRGTDGVGSGAWSTLAAVVFSRLFHFHGVHYLSSRFSLAYAMAPSVHVKGLNVYGGDHSTKGKIRPSNTFTALLGLEFSLTKNWALALDVLNSYSSKRTFKGRTTLPVGHGSSAQVSLAPAIEYNFNEKIGIIAGAWWTVTGRNSAEFTSAVIAVNCYGKI